MKQPTDGTIIESPQLKILWLAKSDYESMCISEYDLENWDITEDGTFISHSSFTYHFGSMEDLGEQDSIYLENGTLDVQK
ncbi:hypothetical protein [Viridibacillus arvi]|uniref:hypothetical protein n=1 Tax=Viridibacillus arvi TaxID=263475 RepID=UPI0034CFC95E